MAAVALAEASQSAGRLEEAIGLMQQIQERLTDDPLVRLSLCDLLHENLGSAPRWWWAVLARWAQSVRIETGQRGALEHFEWLAGEMALMDRKTGNSVDYDELYIAGTLNKRIENDNERLRIAEEVRAVIIRPMALAESPAPPTVAQDAAALAGPQA